MYNIKSVIFGLLALISVPVFSQTFYFKEIKDSTKTAIFGQVAFMDQDSLNLYLVTNTTYSSGYCSATTGVDFIIKVDKQSGNIISSNAIGGNPLAAKITSGFKLNNAIYLGGEMSNLSSKYGVLAKYDLGLNQIVWTFPLNATGSPWNYISSMKFNSNKSNIVYNAVFSYTGTPSAYVGFIDTNGNYLGGVNFGFLNSGAGRQLTNPKFDFSSLDTKFYTITNDFYTDSVYMLKNYNWNFWGQSKKINLKSDGNHHSVSFSKYILNIVNYNNSFTCFITDTAYNFIRSKKFSNVYFKSVGVDGGKAVLSCVNIFGTGEGDQIINIKIDSALNILTSKKMFIDTFGVASLSSATIYNKVSDTYFNLISKKFAYGNSIQLYKSKFPNLYCMEQNYTPTVSLISVTGTLAASSCTGGIGSGTNSLVAYTKGFIDSLYCSAFQGVNEYSDSKKDILIYPNPMNSSLTIEVKDAYYADINIRITDLSGRELIATEMQEVSNKEILFPIAEAGIYLVNIYSKRRLIRVEKVVKIN